MMAWSWSRLVVSGVVVFAGGCGEAAPRVGLVNQEQPVAAGAPVGLENSRDEHHQHSPGGHDLPVDVESIEPAHPAAETKQERALVHIHGPNGVVCSGVVLGPRVVATGLRQPGLRWARTSSTRPRYRARTLRRMLTAPAACPAA